MFGLQFSDALFDRARRRGLAPLDGLATATAFTAHSIADAYRRHLPAMPDEVILCGGGARNATLVRLLKEAVAPARVLTTGDFGIDTDAKEAVSFAILAWLAVRGRPNNVPSATGARRAVVLGKVVPGKDGGEGATCELLRIPGFSASFRRGKKDAAAGRIIPFEKVRRDV
jgi:anhydro-N-acetylmuramic acid kinase